jgi:hypothetical protein|tara:strand:- start:86 stop:232 length:147 start_codon:yes stop_codon:yes gene_type:complete
MFKLFDVTNQAMDIACLLNTVTDHLSHSDVGQDFDLIVTDLWLRLHYE